MNINLPKNTKFPGKNPVYHIPRISAWAITRGGPLIKFSCCNQPYRSPVIQFTHRCLSMNVEVEAYASVNSRCTQVKEELREKRREKSQEKSLKARKKLGKNLKGKEKVEKGKIEHKICMALTGLCRNRLSLYPYHLRKWCGRGSQGCL